MTITLDLTDDFLFTATDADGHPTHFDSKLAANGPQAAQPMDVALQATAACSAMDAVSILRKKRRTVTGFHVTATAERQAEHPRVFTSVHLHYVLTSPDAKEKDLDRSLELSLTTYCPMVALLRAAGVDVTHTAELVRPPIPAVSDT